MRVGRNLGFGLIYLPLVLEASFFSATGSLFGSQQASSLCHPCSIRKTLSSPQALSLAIPCGQPWSLGPPPRAASLSWCLSLTLWPRCGVPSLQMPPTGGRFANQKPLIRHHFSSPLHIAFISKARSLTHTGTPLNTRGRTGPHRPLTLASAWVSKGPESHKQALGGDPSKLFLIFERKKSLRPTQSPVRHLARFYH